MNLRTAISRQIKRKIFTIVCITASVAAFAALGDGGNKNAVKTQQRNLLSAKASSYNFKTFSLKSGYAYRGNAVLGSTTSANRYIILNTVVAYHKGNNTYILPLKKKVLLLDKVKITPAH